jgi:hypothetical protein
MPRPLPLLSPDAPAQYARSFSVWRSKGLRPLAFIANSPPSALAEAGEVRCAPPRLNASAAGPRPGPLRGPPGSLRSPAAGRPPAAAFPFAGR